MGVPRLSIGLPVYNGESLLAEAIEALLGQSYKDFELVIPTTPRLTAPPRYAGATRRRTPGSVTPATRATSAWSRTIISSSESPAANSSNGAPMTTCMIATTCSAASTRLTSTLRPCLPTRGAY